MKEGDFVSGTEKGGPSRCRQTGVDKIGKRGSWEGGTHRWGWVSRTKGQTRLGVKQFFRFEELPG